jgi:hypothetical protein
MTTFHVELCFCFGLNLAHFFFFFGYITRLERNKDSKKETLPSTFKIKLTKKIDTGKLVARAAVLVL